jgi:hypothetical protein
MKVFVDLHQVRNQLHHPPKSMVTDAKRLQQILKNLFIECVQMPDHLIARINAYCSSKRTLQKLAFI